MIENLETTFTFRNMDATESLRIHAMEKLERLNKYLIMPATAHCVLKVEGARHEAEITISEKGGRYVGLDTSNDMYASIDGAVDKIRKQITRRKERVKDHKNK